MMKKILLIFALAVLFAACSPVEYDHSSNIMGTVIDMDDALAVEGAVITMTPGSLNTTTGSDGVFQFNDVDAQQYTVTVQKSGYEANRKTVEALAGETVNISITMKKQKVL